MSRMNRDAYSGYARHRNRGLAPWILFVIVSAVMIVALWFGWQIYKGRSPLAILTKPSGNSVVTVGLRTAPKSLDIRQDDSDALQQALLGNVYETLVKRDDNNNLQPGLASSWEISSDGLNYKFSLQKGVTFSNGDKMTSSSVLRSLQQGITKNYPGYAKLENIKTVTNPDMYTVTIALRAPDPLLLRRLAGRAGIVYDVDARVDYANSALGTGPFTVNNYDAGKSIELSRNNNYWSDPAKCSGITLQYYPSDSALAEAMEHNEVQMAVPKEGTENARLAKIANTNMVEGQSTRVVFIAFNSNTVDSIFEDQWARKAVRSSLDAKIAIADDGNGGVQLGGPIDPLSPGYEDLNNIFPYSAEQARAKFRYFGGRYLKTLDFLVPKGYEKLGKQYSDQIIAFSGAKINLEVLDEDTIAQRIKENKYHLALTTFTHTLDEGSFAENGSAFLFQNAAAQQYWANAARAKNADEYRINASKYARALSENAGAHWLYARKSIMAVKSNISGYTKNMTDQLLPLHDLTVK